MLAISENVLFPGYNHLLTTGTDDPYWRSGDNQNVRLSQLPYSCAFWCMRLQVNASLYSNLGAPEVYCNTYNLGAPAIFDNFSKCVFFKL